MKYGIRIFGLIALAAVITFLAAGCGDVAPRYLSGKVTITPNTNVEVGTELTASYSGSETVDYQWQRGKTNVGTNSNKYTPTEAGSYTVTVSAIGYVSLTSSPVTVAGSGSGEGGAGGECTHNYQWVETTPATLSNANPPVATDGVETKTCSSCGATDGTRPVTYLSYFYGTWENTDYTFVISQGKIRIDRKATADHFELDITSWTPYSMSSHSYNVNVDGTTGNIEKPNYPSGYHIPGTIISQQGLASYQADNTVIFLHKDNRNKMIYSWFGNAAINSFTRVTE